MKLKLIDKAAVVAVIKRRRDALLMRQRNLEAIGQETVLNETVAFELNKIISLIDNLEVVEKKYDIQNVPVKHDIQNVPVDEERLKMDRRNTIC